MTAGVATIRTSGSSAWRRVIGVGLVGAALAIYMSLVGIVPAFAERPMISGVLALGESFILGAMLAIGYAAARQFNSTALSVAAGALAGAITGAGLSALIVIGPAIDLRSIFLNASSALFNVLTLGQGEQAFWIPAVLGVVIGAIGGAIRTVPRPIQRSIAAGLLSLVALGLFANLLRVPLIDSQFATIGRLLFASQGVTLFGAALTLATSIGAGIGAAVAGRMRGNRRWGAVAGALSGLGGSLAGGLLFESLRPGDLARTDAAAVGGVIGGILGVGLGSLLGGAIGRWYSRSGIDARYEALPDGAQRILAITPLIPLLLLALVLPFTFGPVFAQVIVFVAIYILMGLGLNITLGFAGLLDLGFVAFFAVGAYTVALLTSTSPLGLADLPYWAAIPFAVGVAFVLGAFLGLPILGIRGDYLAIATLGFGEIIRILAVSDLLRPILGGPQGITNVPKPFPVPPTDPLAGPNQVYFIALVCAAIVAFVAFRLRDSRIGRAWIAIREDEDVAEALGINLVQTKILAYALGAAFAGLGGAVFVAQIGAAFPTSITLLVSINVAALIIVGGMGSIPGVVVGAVVLIGLPELFREFQEYRYLFYGAALMFLMRFRPEGLLPSRSVQRELHQDENVDEEGQVEGAATAQLEAEKAETAETDSPYSEPPDADAADVAGLPLADGPDDGPDDGDDARAAAQRREDE
jgi:branched-chain amino acid transport system permease protein